jgi:hypothetical protein
MAINTRVLGRKRITSKASRFEQKYCIKGRTSGTSQAMYVRIT